MAKEDKSDDFGGPIFSAFRAFGESLKLPKVTIEDVVNHHKKNLQALEQAAQNTTQGAQQIMAAQRKALEETLADITHMVQDARDGGMNKENARDILADQIAFAKQSFETTIKQASEIGNVVQGTSRDNLEILRKRVQESIAEMKASLGDDKEEPPVKPG